MMLIKFLFAVMGLIFCSLAQSETNPIDISGTYFCTGHDFTNKTDYTVQLDITKEGGIFHEEVAEQGEGNTIGNFLGIIIFAKDSNTTFAKLFWKKDEPTKTGIIISQIQPDGIWKSIWKWNDKPEINTQVCKKSSLE